MSASTAASVSVVLVHGLNRSRLEMVAKTKFLHDQGWNALLFDLRAHGESGGTMRTLGYLERDDVHAAVELARARTAAAPVVLWGISFGGATAVFTAAVQQSRIGTPSISFTPWSIRNMLSGLPATMRIVAPRPIASRAAAAKRAM